MKSRTPIRWAMLLLPLLFLLLMPRTARAQGALSAEARDYLSAALDTMEAVSMRRAEIPWKQVRDSAFLLAAGARRPTDTYGAISWALRRVDRHSFLQAKRGGVAPEMVGGRFGYLRVPFYSGPSQAPLADSLQDALRTLDTAGACGWIVDLRMNGGGNVWPMQAGIGPLLGDSVISLELKDGRPVSRSLYVNGDAIAEEPIGTRQVVTHVANAYRVRNAAAPVAVLIDGATASSAEGIAIAFRPRPNTRFFGMPTAGYTTINRGAQLPDGANMVVTVGAMTDRDGRPYAEALQPDERVEMPAGFWPSATDAVARRAAEWLARQPGCAARR